MSYATFRDKLKRDNCLGKADTLGSFDFYTTIISLDAVERSHLTKIQSDFPDYAKILASGQLSPELYVSIKSFFPLATHEYTHFVDATSTIWGLRHLELMNAAYDCSDLLGGKEPTFRNAKSFFDHVRSIRLPSYYTMVEEGIHNERPWELRPTVGYAFDLQGRISERPIVFARFLNARKQGLARSPISMVSLLEASAMAQEIIASTAFLRMTPEEFQLVEQRGYVKNVLDLLYDPTLTEYSVCVHVVANQQRCQDIHLAFRLCSVLTRIALNFPEAAFQSVLSKCDIAKLLDNPKTVDTAQALHRGIILRDRCVLFYLLSLAVPKGTTESLNALTDGIAAALKELGTSYEDVSEAFVVEADSIRRRIGKSQFKSLNRIVDAGFSNLQKISLLESRLNFSALELPNAWLGDLTQVNPFAGPESALADLSVDDIFDELSAGESWIRRFAEGCFWSP